jgi:hypothetical protein
MPVPDPILLNNMYFKSSGQVTYRLNLTDANDDLTLPKGQYFIYLVTTSAYGATLDYGSTAVPPTDDSTTQVPGQFLPPATMMPLVLSEETTVNAIMNEASATGALFFTKVRG